MNMKKIVFLPLSPNMWEGFETLWDEAKKNKNNVVTVIPVPTYKRDSSGNITDTEYTLSGYPDEVEITDVNAFNFQEEHPDTIYLQNAQDLGCRAFLVNPFFFTGNLRQYTDNLVYVPYDCHPESYIDSKEEIEDKKTFLIPLNIMNIDHIIVQSESIKQLYLKCIAGLNSDLYNEWDKKITWKDFPRTNILKKYTKETVPHPLEWDEFLCAKKETHLLCTSIFNVLEGNRTFLKELFTTIKHYQSVKNEFLLIWRPHKEIINVLIRLRPELVEEYKEIISYYKNNSTGILDETPTPTPAIILSDKYIGASCGTMELFKSTGKKIEII